MGNQNNRANYHELLETIKYSGAIKSENDVKVAEDIKKNYSKY